MDSAGNALGAVTLAAKARSYGQWIVDSAQSAAHSASEYVEDKYEQYEHSRDSKALAAHSQGPRSARTDAGKTDESGGGGGYSWDSLKKAVWSPADQQAGADSGADGSAGSSQWSSKITSAAAQAKEAAVRGWDATTNAYKGNESEDHLSNVLKQYHMNQNMENGPSGNRRNIPGWLVEEERQRTQPVRTNSEPGRNSNTSSLRDIYDSYSEGNPSSNSKKPSRPRPQQQRSLPTGSGASDRLRRMKEESAARFKNSNS